MTSLICPYCGYAPLIIRGSPLTLENVARIRIFCPDCAWPFGRADVERLFKRYGKKLL